MANIYYTTSELNKPQRYVIVRTPLTVNVASASSQIANFNVNMTGIVDHFNSIIAAQNSQYVSHSLSLLKCNDALANVDNTNGFLTPVDNGANSTGHIYESGEDKYDLLEVLDEDGRIATDAESNELFAKIDTTSGTKLLFVKRSNGASASVVPGNYIISMIYVFPEFLKGLVQGSLVFDFADTVSSGELYKAYVETTSPIPLGSMADGLNDDIILNTANNRKIHEIISVEAIDGSRVIMLAPSYYAIYNETSVILVDVSPAANAYGENTQFRVRYTSASVR